MELASLGLLGVSATDSSGSPLESVRVAVSSKAMEVPFEAKTTREGLAVFVGLPLGAELEVEGNLSGYSSARSSVSSYPGLFPRVPFVSLSLLRRPFLKGVVFGEDGYPLAGSRIALRSPNQRRESRSAVDGSFCFEGTEAMGYLDLEVSAQGFATLQRQVPASASEVDVGELRLKSEKHREGTVRGPRGEPISGAKIALVTNDQAYEDFIETWPSPPPWATTDQEGRFRLEGLPRGNNMALLVSARDYFPAFVPLGADEASLEIVLRKAVYLRGTVVDENGAPTSALVDLGPLDGSATAGLRQETDAQGQFVLGPVKPGRRRIRAIEALMQEEEGELIDVPPEGIDGLLLTLKRSVTFRGWVVESGSQPLPNAYVKIEYPNQVERGSKTGPDGSFAIEELAAGQATIKAGHEAYGSVELPIGLSPGMPAQTIQLPPFHPVQLTIVASSGLGVIEGAEVKVTDASFRARSFRAISDWQGVVRFTDLPSGRYVVEAQHPQFVPKKVEVALEPGAEREVQLQLEAAGKIEGRLQSISTADLSQLQVTAWGETKALHAEIDLDRSNGHFTVTGLAPGKWIIGFGVGGFRRIRQEVLVRPGINNVEIDWSVTDQ